MKKKKIRVAILFGGKSAEHEVSIRSAKNVIRALDKDKYEVVSVKISKTGRCRWDALKKCDVVFPVMHGTYGEDGSVQGLLKMFGLPFVGPDILGSAVSMDKDTTNRLFCEAGLPKGKFIAFTRESSIDTGKIIKKLGLPLFVKPANLGSSVGITKVKKQSDLKRAVDKAFKYGQKVLVEEFIQGREIECGILGNEHPIASVPGEIIPTHEFYSYEAKYIDPHGARLEIPAQLPPTVTKKIQKVAVAAFKALGLEGMARVDLFLTKNNQIFLNEVNPIPGFTNISMYPKLWEASGISGPKLIDMLIKLALERHRKVSRLKTSYQ